MRTVILSILLVFATMLSAQTANCKLISWNIRDFGKSKNDAEIAMMAQILRGYDVIAIQEVVAKHPGGAKAVARLTAALDQTGADYDYKVSDPTQSSSGHTRERYAFIWRTSTVKLVGRPRLLSAYAKTIEREPYFATFSWEGKEFNVVNLHARPHDQQPEQELAALRIQSLILGLNVDINLLLKIKKQHLEKRFKKVKTHILEKKIIF